MEIFNRLVDDVRSFEPSVESVTRAAGHLCKADLKYLYSPDFWHVKNSQGHLFEALIYDHIVRSSDNNGLIGAIVRKNADVPWKYKKFVRWADGIFHAIDGGIVIRGNGQDLAEIDVLLCDNEGRAVFLEILNSNNNLKDFDEEIRLKKQLIGKMFKQSIVPALIVSSCDITNRASVKRILSEDSNKFVQTVPFDAIEPLIVDDIEYGREPGADKKLIYAYQLPLKGRLNYLSTHNHLRNRILSVSNKGIEGPALTPEELNENIVQKVFLGRLTTDALRRFCEQKEVLMDNRRLDFEAMEKNFSGAILAVSMPEARPVIYLRARDKRLYVRLGPRTLDVFKFEKNIVQMTGIFHVLDGYDRWIGPGTMSKLFKKYLIDDVTGNRRKRPEGPAIAII